MKTSHRIALLGSALTATTFLISAPAQATCAVTPGYDTVTCATTSTTDTTYAGVSPASDRNYGADTSSTAFNGTVSTGAVVSGFGLSFRSFVGSTYALNVVNNGAIQVDVGNNPTGGTGALNISAIGPTDIVYTGNGSIANLGGIGLSDGLYMTSAGTGNITSTVGGDILTSGGTSYGIASFANGTAGNNSVTTLTGATVRGGSYGIFASNTTLTSAGTVSVNNSASILSRGAFVSQAALPNTLGVGIYARTSGTGSVSVTNNGAIGSVADRTTTSGVFGVINNATSAAAINVSGSGAIFSSGNGLIVNNAGLGTTTVNYTGAINSINLAGIKASSTTGTTTITAGAVTTTAWNAIEATTTTGAIVVNANGAVNASGSGLSGSSTSGAITLNANANVTSGGNGLFFLGTTGAQTANVAAGATIDSTTVNDIAFSGTGPANVNNSGIVGANTLGVAVNASGAGVTTVNNLAGGVINGSMLLSANADVVTNAGTLNTAGTTDFGAGADLLTNTGTINAAAGTTFLGLETFNNSGAGILNANSGLTFDGGATALTNTGTLNSAGTIDFGAGTDSFANSGAGIFNLTASTTLAGLETFSNSGRINLNTFTLTGPAIAFNNTGTIDTNGSATLAGFTSFSNAGTLDLAAGTFTVPAAVFTNTGTILADEGASTIAGQTSFANSGLLNLQDGATGDFLTINSNYLGSGAAALAIDAGSTTSDRLIITGAASGSTRVDVNALAPAINPAGLLVVDTGTSTTGAFVLGAVTGATAPLIDYRLSQVGQGYYLVSTPSALAYQPLAIGHLGSDMWYQSADVYAGYAALRRGDLRSDRTTGGGIWAQLYGSRDTYGDATTVTAFGSPVTIDGRMRTERRGAQVGMDFLPIGAGFVIGATGGYQHAKANLRGYGDALDANGFNLGIYAMFGAKSGLYGGLLVKHDRDKIRLNERAFGDAGRRLRSTSNGIDAEIGYRMGLSAMNLDLNAGISHVRTKVDDFVVGPLGYDLRGAKSMRGRLGARLGLGGAWGPYIDAKLLHEFKGNSRLILSGGGTSEDVTTAGRGTWGRIEVGAGANNSPGPILAGWAEFGDVKGLGARAGFRF